MSSAELRISGFFKLIICLFPLSLLFAEGGFTKQRIGYLLHKEQYEEALALYQNYKKERTTHDFELLEQIGRIVLEKGMQSEDEESGLLSIYGAGIVSLTSSMDILAKGISSPHLPLQLAAIQFLARLQDDRTDELLGRAMSSDFLYARMEAAYQLAARKSRKAVGQIESLMYKLPPPARYLFPPLFALIGTAEAITILRHLMNDREVQVRIAAILSAAMEGRDDLLPVIRTSATHLHSAEQEACAAALGYLRDSSALPLLEKLARSPSANVKLAALFALYTLGKQESEKGIAAMAKEGDLFAIHVLADIPTSSDHLLPLLSHEQASVRLNSALALLKHRDPRASPPLLEFLLSDTRDLGFSPLFSLGNSFYAWKIIPSLRQHLKDGPYDYTAVTLHVREKILREALELPERDFIYLVERILAYKQQELVPLACALLENLHTPEAIALLKKYSQMMGAPFIRTYCHLSLYRLGQEQSGHVEILKQWVSSQKKTKLIRFRPSLPWALRVADKNSFELTPEESSLLLIAIYEAFTRQHSNESIDFLLDGILSGHPKNRPVLAGLLLQAIQ